MKLIFNLKRKLLVFLLTAVMILGYLPVIDSHVCANVVCCKIYEKHDWNEAGDWRCSRCRLDNPCEESLDFSPCGDLDNCNLCKGDYVISGDECGSYCKSCYPDCSYCKDVGCCKCQPCTPGPPATCSVPQTCTRCGVTIAPIIPHNPPICGCPASPPQEPGQPEENYHTQEPEPTYDPEPVFIPAEPYDPAPAPIWPPQPDEDGVLSLSADDLNTLWESAEDDVMVLIIEGDPDFLEISVPLNWFISNPGATLLVFNPELGLMAITSDNLIELAALAFDGENGHTVVVRGKEFILNPDTIITYIMERGSLVITVTADGESLQWYIYDSPLILAFPGRYRVEFTNLVVAQVFEDGSRKIISRSLVRELGLVYALVNNEGRFILVSNFRNFNDSRRHLHEDSINFLAAREIVTGVGEGLFEPDRPITRAEFTTMLASTMDFVMPAEYNPEPFADVFKDSWYYEQIIIMAELGLADSMCDGMFGPDLPINREDMFNMVYRALINFHLITPGRYRVCPLESFADAEDISWYAEVAIRELSGHGLIKADEEGLANPKGNTTRAEAALFMENIIRYIVPDFTTQLREARNR